MKNVKDLKQLALYMGVFFLSITFTSCSDDDDEGDVVVEPTGAITAQEQQTLSQNTLVVDQVVANSDVWLVARKTDANGEIMAQTLITEETAANIELTLEGTSLQEGDTVQLMLYEDDSIDGGDGTFEEGTDDELIEGATETVTISQPAFTITDPTVTNNSITFDNVTINESGWIVLYNGDPADGTSEVIGSQFVTGSQDSVTVQFEEGFTWTSGQEIFARLHLDDPADEVFTFEDNPAEDVAEFFGFETDNTIAEPIVLQ